MASAATASKPDYGLDLHTTMRSMFSRAGWTLLFAMVLYYVNHVEYPGVSVRLLIVLGGIALAFLAAGIFMVWSSRVAKFQVRDEILDALQLRGDERVLDLGCGAGLMLVGLAKRLKTGRVTGVDFSGSSETAKENAKLEGVADKVRIDTGNDAKLVYPDGQFDVAVSALAFHQIGDPETRERLVREMLRTLKPGGRLAIFDVLKVGEISEMLRRTGATSLELSPVRVLWCLPARWVRATK
jgi:SAM-dependent methyltransferase